MSVSNSRFTSSLAVSSPRSRYTAPINASSPRLFLACASGQHLKSAILTARKAGEQPQEFLQIKLTDVLISSYQSGGGDQLPVDQVSLDFAKIEYGYKPQDAKGSLLPAIQAGWDLMQNKILIGLLQFDQGLQ